MNNASLFTTQLSKIKSELKNKIHSGQLQQGQKIPSERALSALFDTTRITIKYALVALETEGVIYREKRRGWYVSPERITYNPLSRCHFHQMVNDQNRTAQTNLIKVREELSNDNYLQALALKQPEPVLIIERLRFIDGRAVLFVENVLREKLFEGILEECLTSSLTLLYQNKYGYQTSKSKFEVLPTAAPYHVAQALNLAEGQPVLKIQRTNCKQDGELIDCEFEYWRPDAVRIRID
ncbi:UTRA domain-containing protein [Vibrio rumoiensis]|uniref:UTRA domain-containing protein n=1 Tax=Vibrio rumoiensis TaxID=76258 RepID=UPI003AA83E3F